MCTELLRAFHATAGQNRKKTEKSKEMVATVHLHLNHSKKRPSCFNLSSWSSKTALKSEKEKNYRREEGEKRHIHLLTKLGWRHRVCDQMVHIQKSVKD